MQPCLPASVDLVKNIVKQIFRYRDHHHSSAPLTLSAQEHITSLCFKQIPVCLDVFVSCDCVAYNREAFYTASRNFDIECHKNDPRLVHVERWTCTFLSRRSCEEHVTEFELCSAIDDCLRKSQFTTWLKSNKKKKSYHISYRLGAPDEVAEMSVDVFFAQVFPIVNIDRSICLQAAMASFFDPIGLKLSGCAVCMENQNLLPLTFESMRHINEKAFASPSMRDSISGAAALGRDDTSLSVNNIPTANFNSNSSSRSESPIISLLSFDPLNLPIVNIATANSFSGSKNDRTLEIRQLRDGELEQFNLKVTQEPVEDSLCVNSDIMMSIDDQTPQLELLKDKHSKSSERISMQAPRSVRIRALPPRLLGAKNTVASTPRLINPVTGLPLHSSPAPSKRMGVKHFNFDPQLNTPRRIRSCVSSSEAAPSSSLLGSFEESILNGRILPVGAVNGFNATLAASGTFCAPHISLPVAAYFFQLDEATHPWSSPYLGVVNLRQLGTNDGSVNSTVLAGLSHRNRSRYYIPSKGTVQVTLFNPNRTVLKMFVILYDLSEMPPSCTTFIRQRILYMPIIGNLEVDKGDKSAGFPDNKCPNSSFLRYLIHLRVATSSRGRLFLHSDIRLIFASDKFEFDSRIAAYEMRSFTELPCNPRFSPRK